MKKNRTQRLNEIVDCIKEGFDLKATSEITETSMNYLSNALMPLVYHRFRNQVDFSGLKKEKFKKLQNYLVEHKDEQFKFKANRGVSNPVKKNKGAVTYAPVVEIRKEYSLEMKLKKEIEELQDRLAKLQLKLEVLEELKQELGA